MLSTIGELLKSWLYSIANHCNEPKEKGPAIAEAFGEQSVEKSSKTLDRARFISQQELREFPQELALR